MNKHAKSPDVPAVDTVLIGRVVTDGYSIEDALVAIAQGALIYAGPRAEAPVEDHWPASERLPESAVLLPGLIDLHCHGGAGFDFASGSVEDARAAAAFHRRSGTTTLLGSLVTAAPEDLVARTRLLAQLAEDDEIAGIHWEGPFLSPQRAGAQDPQYLLDPDLELVQSLITASGGYGASMTLAPELPGASELIDLLTISSIVPSIGHTDADASTTRAALTQAAAELTGSSGVIDQRPTATHLFNAMRPLHHRDPGPIAASLEAAGESNAVVELIADNVHLSPDTVKMVFSTVGASCIALVTDAMAAAGCADGNYQLGPAKVVVTHGVARLADGDSIAGGTSTLLDVVRCTVAAGVPIEDAVLAATYTPASVLGLADSIGSLREGHQADILVCDEGLNLHRVMRSGEWLTD
ncbi:amidohydrolase family protein [Saxibacter everestensis]|uniref:Amidohydrolase family protein n=1 Tax=Saxibacter everestensis TaxID=2909229 RepID=A0ABY8QQ41_9MICO|nr:amidohydrolase family protein [Brevibacteriaceae bacterium ZFBP1038]